LIVIIDFKRIAACGGLSSIGTQTLGINRGKNPAKALVAKKV
jgi:hypothetical protein